MGQENVNVPVNSIVILIKFDSEANRAKAIESEKFKNAAGLLNSLSLEFGGQVITKNSKNTKE